MRHRKVRTSVCGDAGRAWCDHDSRYLLAWALEDARVGTVAAVEQIQWLGRVLAGRDFPVDRLAHHVELTARVVENSVAGEQGRLAAVRLPEAANELRVTHLAPLPTEHTVGCRPGSGAYLIFRI